MPPHQIEKHVWTDKDFNVMGWHDATIWAMVAKPEAFEYMLDLDYVFSWVHPSPNETYYKFWVCPVTMVFDNAADIVIDLRSQQGSIEVADLHRKLLGLSPNAKFEQYEYHFECQEGRLTLQATGYRMYVRKQPSLLGRQSFGLDERGGISFDRTRSDA